MIGIDKRLIRYLESKFYPAFHYNYKEKFKQLFNSKVYKTYDLSEFEKELRYGPFDAEDRFAYLLIYRRFLDYLKEKNVDEVKSIITKEEWNHIKKNHLMILMQEAKSLDELNSMLGMEAESNNLAKTLRRLNDGVDINDNFVKVYPRNRGLRQTDYLSNDDLELLDMKTSVNPIGLVLNNAEIYTLLVGVLQNLDKESIYYNTYLNIANKIYTQLSPSAKKMTCVNMDLKNVRLEYIPIQEMNDKKEVLLYSIKAGEKIRVQFKYNNKTIEGIAIVKFDFQNNGYIVELDDKKFNIEREDFLLCKRLHKGEI